MLAYAPGRIRPGTKVNRMTLNLDMAQTVLAAMEVAQPDGTPEMSGRSLLPMLLGQAQADWRKHLLYEYHWEWNFPATPTTLAIRTDRYKYIYYHGIWDKNGLYDLQTDPHERHNLIRVPAFAELADKLKNQLFTELGEMGGLTMPIRPPKDFQFYDRKLRR
jgi:Arylsulfatase A and related enzymes